MALSAKRQAKRIKAQKNGYRGLAKQAKKNGNLNRWIYAKNAYSAIARSGQYLTLTKKRILGSFSKREYEGKKARKKYLRNKNRSKYRKKKQQNPIFDENLGREDYMRDLADSAYIDPDVKNRNGIEETNPKGLKKVLDSLVESSDGGRYKKRGKFLAKEGNKYVAIDNSTGDAWTEEFDSKSKAKKWLRNG